MLRTAPTGLTDLDQRLATDARVGLLVSVRNADEASAALAGGADVIDVKEPADGPLGRADAESIGAVVARVAGRAPVTAAWGELAEPARQNGVPGSLAAVKVGLAGADSAGWESDLRAFAKPLPPATQLVPVAYADAAAAESPAPDRVLDAAVALGCRWLVIDTFDKQGPSSVAGDRSVAIRVLVERATDAGVSTVLAGRLGTDDLANAVACGPALVGVRGAACDGGRGGAVSTARVQSIAQAIAGCRTPA